MRRALRLVAGVLLACSSDRDPSSNGSGGDGGNAMPCSGLGEVYAPGMSKLGQEGAFTFRLQSAAPEPPALLDNSWLVTIDTTTGPAAQAELSVKAQLADGTQLSPKAVNIVEISPGSYQVSSLHFHVEGLWNVRLAATFGSEVDDATFQFCIQ